MVLLYAIWRRTEIGEIGVDYIKNFIKGIVVGVATLVPGVSGGTMAIVLGIYDRLIHSVGSFFEDWRKNFFFLFQVGIGGLLGILLFNRLMLRALEVVPYVMQFLFIGIIIGGLPVLYKKAMSIEATEPAERSHSKKQSGTMSHSESTDNSESTNRTGSTIYSGTMKRTGSMNRPYISDILFFIIGVAIVLLMTSKPDTVINLATGSTLLSYIFLLLAGVIFAVALVLPGISFSFMLLALGMYDITLKAIKDFNIPYLIPLGLGVALGTFGTARFLERMLQKHPRKTYMIIIGFVVGSLIEVFPGIPPGWQLPVSIAAFILGFAAMHLLGRKGVTD